MSFTNSLNNTLLYVPQGITATVNTVMADTVSVSREEYEELQADSKLLYALIDEGIEEWEGYDRAILNI